jgi:hypothetical protein
LPGSGPGPSGPAGWTVAPLTGAASSGGTGFGFSDLSSSASGSPSSAGTSVTTSPIPSSSGTLLLAAGAKAPLLGSPMS